MGLNFLCFDIDLMRFIRSGGKKMEDILVHFVLHVRVYLNVNVFAQKS